MLSLFFLVRIHKMKKIIFLGVFAAFLLGTMGAGVRNAFAGQTGKNPFSYGLRADDCPPGADGCTGNPKPNPKPDPDPKPDPIPKPDPKPDPKPGTF